MRDKGGKKRSKETKEDEELKGGKSKGKDGGKEKRKKRRKKGKEEGKKEKDGGLGHKVCLLRKKQKKRERRRGRVPQAALSSLWRKAGIFSCKSSLISL